MEEDKDTLDEGLKMGPHWIYPLYYGFLPFLFGVLILIFGFFIDDLSDVMDVSFIAEHVIVLRIMGIVGISLSLYGILAACLVNHFTRYFAHPEKLILHKGIIHQDKIAIRFGFVSDVDVSRTIFDAMVGCGNLKIRMLDKQGVLTVKCVDDPERWHKYILKRAATLKAIGTGG